MLFNSWLFPPFLLIVLVLYRFLPNRSQNAMLLLASYFFYACWDWRFLGLLLLSTSCDWLLARAISREPTRESAKRWVACSVGINLAFLGFFKYFNFFIDSANNLFRGLGLSPWNFHLEVILPVGISFYTFQSISYIVNVYRGDIEKPYRLRALRGFLSTHGGWADHALPGPAPGVSQHPCRAPDASVAGTKPVTRPIWRAEKSEAKLLLLVRCRRRARKHARRRHEVRSRPPRCHTSGQRVVS